MVPSLKMRSISDVVSKGFHHRRQLLLLPAQVLQPLLVAVHRRIGQLTLHLPQPLCNLIQPIFHGASLRLLRQIALHVLNEFIPPEHIAHGARPQGCLQQMGLGGVAVHLPIDLLIPFIAASGQHIGHPTQLLPPALQQPTHGAGTPSGPHGAAQNYQSVFLQGLSRLEFLQRMGGAPHGIQPGAEDRVAIARRIKKAALAAGIPQEDLYIDCLTLTASAQQKDVLATVEALHTCKTELGVLGVSNISFGLPCRTYLNTTFLTMAMYAGLDLAIMNPSSEEMMAAVYAYNVLTNRDPQSTRYIERYANRVPASTALAQANQNAVAAQGTQPGGAAEVSGPYAPLIKAVEKGLKGEAAAQTRALLETKEALELVDEALIPALDIVGNKYEKGTLYLPQLLQAASAAQSAFEEIKTAIAKKGGTSESKGRIVIATVKGDVHDIGKNIVKVILENYGFEVIDLGRDVPVETVVNTVREKNVHLVGLSALMTTTLKSMEETIAALHAAKLDCKIMVGGAVLTPEYAEKIGADWYAKDAKRSADIAKEFFGV